MIEHELLLRMEARVREAAQKAAWLWVTYFMLVLRALLFALVATIEFELLYRTFQAISGKDNEYWSPALMACTGLIMLSAFHLLAAASDNNLAVKLVQRLTPYQIGLYLVGLGLLVAGVIYLDAGSILLESTSAIVIGGLPDSQPEAHWLNAVFEEITNPLALAVFSFGIGGLAIVNLFVAHGLLQGMKAGFTKIQGVKPEADRLGGERKTVEAQCTRHRELQQELHAVNLWSHPRILQEASVQLAGLIQDAATKHRRYIKHRDLQPPPGLLTLADPVDPKLIERELKKLEAPDLKSILKILQAHFPEDKE
jgi:hypothetical protein